MFAEVSIQQFFYLYHTIGKQSNKKKDWQHTSPILLSDPDHPDPFGSGDAKAVTHCHTDDYRRKGTIRSATTLRILIIGFTAGPAVSL